MTTPASAAPAPITASPATSEPVKGNVLEWFAVLAATWEPGALGGVLVVPPGYDVTAKAAVGASTPSMIPPAAATRSARPVIECFFTTSSHRTLLDTTR